MSLEPSFPAALPARAGILILNYHQPEATLACVRRLLEREGDATRILWLEGDAGTTRDTPLALLRDSGLPWVQVDPAADPLPRPGQIGFVAIPGNLGYAGGNNVGLKFLQRHGVEFAWVMNNDTLLVRGSSLDLIAAAEARPDVALWGMWVTSPDAPTYIGLRMQRKDFAVEQIADPMLLATDPMSFINGCAMFFRVEAAMAQGGIPEEYFMYYEDQAFTWELRKPGRGIAAVETVEVWHAQSLTTGHRSRFTEFYCRRNRWHFIQKYFPEQLRRQRWRFFTYQVQKLLFRLRFDRIRLEFLAFLDFRQGRLGQSRRRF